MIDGVARGGRYQPISRDQSQTQQQAAQQPKGFLDYSFKIFSCCGIPIHVHYLLPAFFILSFVFWARVKTHTHTIHKKIYVFFFLCPFVYSKCNGF